MQSFFCWLRSTVLGHDSNNAVSQAYQPIIRGYFVVACAYYGILSLIYITTLEGKELLYLGGAAIVTFAASATAVHALRRPLSISVLEAVTTVINMLVLANAFIALHVEFDQAKLSYFIILTTVFALASVTMRQALLSMTAALCGLFVELQAAVPGKLTVYGFIGFGTAVGTIAIAYFLRRSIKIALIARHEAVMSREDAEKRLATAERISLEMRRQSRTDSLTGLPNRRAFFDELQNRRDTVKEGVNVWLALLDLDGFKAVNDNYGHTTGDELLKQVARRLTRHCGARGHASRMGGDEFNILFNTDHAPSDVQAWCDTLLAELAAGYAVDGRVVLISGSIGCYRAEPGETGTQMLQKADYALMNAKKLGKNRVILFQQQHAKGAAERFRIEQALRSADFKAELQLVFQPQFDAEGKTLVRAEALARWCNPVIGAIDPKSFVVIAEDCGLIDKITLEVLDKAIATLKHWDDPIPISINLSGNDLISEQISGRIIERLRACGLPPSLIEFEVTETAMMPDIGKASANLRKLAEMGHPIALDDFGTGYSNFNYLRTLPFGKLKIDRSFIEDLADPMTENVLRALVGMARTLNVPCLIEGVETELELMLAKRAGAQLVQGFLFGKPMPAAELLECRDRRALPAYGSQGDCARVRPVLPARILSAAGQ